MTVVRASSCVYIVFRDYYLLLSHALDRLSLFSTSSVSWSLEILVTVKTLFKADKPKNRLTFCLSFSSSNVSFVLRYINFFQSIIRTLIIFSVFFLEINSILAEEEPRVLVLIYVFKILSPIKYSMTLFQQTFLSRVSNSGKLDTTFPQLLRSIFSYLNLVKYIIKSLRLSTRVLKNKKQSNNVYNLFTYVMVIPNPLKTRYACRKNVLNLL
jgi:hypothetical protein